MRRYLVVMLGGFVIGGIGVGAYRRVHERPVEVASPAQVKTVAADLIPDGDVQAVLEELARMKPGISVSDWKQAHPEDQKESEVKLDACAAFRWSKALADGNTLRREAEFYPPDPPEGMALPLNADAANLISSCTLTSVGVELEVDGREKLLRSVSRIQAELTKRMGEPDAKLPPYSYPLGSPWHAGEASVVIEKNTDVNPLFASNGVSNTLRVRWQSQASLVTYAYLPRVLEEKKERASEQNEVASPETSPEIFDLAMRTAAIDQADLVKTMNDLYQECYQHPQLSANDASYQEKRTTPGLERGRKVVDALTQWLNLTRDLPAQRKAGALLAAHFLLTDATDRLDNGEMEAMRDWLLDKKVIASENELGPLGTSAKWAKDARDLDSDGPIGDAVMLIAITNPLQVQEFLPHGYVPVAMAEGQKDVTDFVIDAGQKYLEKPRDPELKERVEYFIGLAYCDRIQISNYGDEKPSGWQVQRAAAAKPEALKHFAAAASGNSPRAVTAWRNGWRVLAGLPIGIRFYDIGD